MQVNRELRLIADRQAGYFSAAQARLAGYPNDLQRYHFSCGNWQIIERAIFRLPGYSDSVESLFVRWSLWAAGQSSKRAVAVSHESALYYYGLQFDPPAATHLIVSSLRRQHDAPGCVLHLDRLERGDYENKRGFCILTPVKTLQTMRPDLVLASQWEPTLRLAFERGLIGETAYAGLVGAGGERRGLVAGFSAVAAPTPRMALPAPVSPEVVAVSAGKQGDGGAMMTGTVPLARQMSGRYSEWVSQGKSFTLVEMLVVISIICVLAGMLLPALNKAVASGRAAACLNNLRQLGTGFTMYADSGDGRYPFSIDNSNAIWVTKLCPYLGMTWNGGQVSRGEQGVFNCPENSRQLFITSTGPTIDETRASYGINGYATQAFFEANPASSNNPAGNNSRRFTHPGELRVVTDNQYFRLEYGHNNGVGTGDNSVPVNYGIGPRNMRYAHNFGANLLHADGHAAFANGPLEDRGAFQGMVGGINKYVNGRMWMAIYPF